MKARKQQLAARDARSGMTLIEVMLAVFILAVCLIGLMQGMTASSSVFHTATFIQQAGNVLARGDAAYPMEVNSTPEEDLTVSPDTSLVDGWSYERICEEDEDEDGLYVVRVLVKQGNGGFGNEIEYVSLFYFPEGSQGEAVGGGVGG